MKLSDVKRGQVVAATHDITYGMVLGGDISCLSPETITAVAIPAGSVGQVREIHQPKDEIPVGVQFGIEFWYLDPAWLKEAVNA